MFTLKDKREALKKLSQETQDYLGSNILLDSIFSIAEPFNIENTELDILTSEVYVTILGLQSKDDLITNITQNLKLEPTAISQIIKDVESKILNNVKDSYQASNRIPALEDAKGNADNVPPVLPGEKVISAKPAERPQPAVSDADFEARQQALKAGEFVMKTAYGNKPDPYREPLQ